MRIEKEMLDLIINIVIEDERIWVVIMNGLCVNLNVKRDCF